MAVKRRKSKQRLSPMDEMILWSMLFQCGTDYTDSVDQVLDPYRPGDAPGGVLGELSPSEREKTIRDAWFRLGSLYLASPDHESQQRASGPAWRPWALLRYGEPDEADR